MKLSKTKITYNKTNENRCEMFISYNDCKLIMNKDDYLYVKTIVNKYIFTISKFK